MTRERIAEINKHFRGLCKSNLLYATTFGKCRREGIELDDIEGYVTKFEITRSFANNVDVHFEVTTEYHGEDAYTEDLDFIQKDKDIEDFVMLGEFDFDYYDYDTMKGCPLHLSTH